MRILQIHPGFDVRGGAEAYCVKLSAELVARGHDVTVLTTTAVPDGDFQVLQLPHRATERLARAIRRAPVTKLLRHGGDLLDVTQPALARKALGNARFDVCHVHNWQTLGAPLVRALSRRAPLALTVHDYALIDPSCTALKLRNASPALRMALAVRRRALEALLSDAHLIWPAARTRRLHLDAGWSPRAAETVIPHGWNVEVIDREDRDLTSGPVTFLYAGQLSSHKGVDLLLDQWEGGTTDSRAQLLVAGAGPLEHAVRRLAAVNPQVKFLGYVVGDGKRAAFAAADFFLFPSQWPENFPISVLEAHGAALPVISSRQALPPTCTPNENSLVFDETQPLHQILAEAVGMSPERYRRIAEASVAQAAAHGWKGHVDAVENEYGTLVQQ